MAAKSNRVRLERKRSAVLTKDLILVDAAFAEIRNENFPDPGRTSPPHGMTATIPHVEIADDRDAPSIRRPNGEMHTRDALMRQGMGTQNLPDALMGAFGQKVFIHFADHGPKRIGVEAFPRIARLVRASKHICTVWDRAGEDSGGIRNRGEVIVLVALYGFHRNSAGVEGRHCSGLTRTMRSKD